MNRAVAVARMHLVDRTTLILMPLGICAASFVINILIWRYIPVASRTTGGALSIPIFIMYAAVLGVTRGIYFALGMGATRRSFMLGTALVGAGLAASFAFLVLALGVVERATHGWGQRGHFFDMPWFDGWSPVAVWLVLFVPTLAMYLLGALGASIWVRWSTRGLNIMSMGGVLVTGVATVLVSRAQAWPAIGSWLFGLTPFTAAGWAAVLCLLFAGASHLTLRRFSV